MFVVESKGRVARCVNITIMDNNALEGDKTFHILIILNSTSNTDVMLEKKLASITILDDEG